MYNLTFGDWNEDLNRIEDQIKSNNGDRTRLYQMNISSYFAIITVHFKIEGFIRNKWEPFRTGCDYKAFLISHRNELNL